MINYISEIGSNFATAKGKSLDRAYTLIDKAKEIGCTSVKFQLFKANRLYHSSKPQLIKYNKLNELPIEWIPKLSLYCRKTNIRFGLSVFYEEAIDEVKQYVDFLKISSYDILRESLIKKCLDTDLPIIISLGLATYGDVERLNKLCFHAKEVTFMHCVSKYPTKLEECNIFGMLEIMDLIQSINHHIGYSDHSVQGAALVKAATLGATTIETHIDLEDRKGNETSHRHCWLPYKLKTCIDFIHKLEIVEGFMELIVNEEERKYMSDPDDGLRPLKNYR